MENRLYRMREYKTYSRYHYVWAPDENTAERLFSQYEDDIDNDDFEFEFDECEVEEDDYPEYIVEDFGGFILNPEDKDGCTN